MPADSVALTDVPETMLWTLHNRGSEAVRPDGLIKDPEAARLYQTIAYEYERNFGKADGSHAVRSRVFDDAVRAWMRSHPGGLVVELGCGLETQFHRCDDGKVRWLCVDVPEAMAVRERYLPPANDRLRHLAKSALDLTWLDDVEPLNPGKGVFITAQGLLMYFQEGEVRQLLATIVDRLPGVTIMFDVIPRWFSKATLKGMKKTEHYTTPPMPWGINRNEIKPFLHSAHPGITKMELMPYGFFRTWYGKLFPVASLVPFFRNYTMWIVRLQGTPNAPSGSVAK